MAELRHVPFASRFAWASAVLFKHCSSRFSCVSPADTVTGIVLLDLSVVSLERVHWFCAVSTIDESASVSKASACVRTFFSSIEEAALKWEDRATLSRISKRTSAKRWQSGEDASKTQPRMVNVSIVWYYRNRKVFRTLTDSVEDETPVDSSHAPTIEPTEHLKGCLV